MQTRNNTRPLITLLTDFGTDDPYVGIMKGVILEIAPEAAIVDLTHAVSPYSIREAAFLLATAIRYFPPFTVHLVVVDPGVGGNRRPIAVRTRRSFFVAPDNGVLSFALAQDPPTEIVELANPRYRLPLVSATFHGRDIFAPAAAYLARGEVPIQEFGPVLPALMPLPGCEPELREDGTLVGSVIHVDRFGNCITNIPAATIQSLGSEVQFVLGEKKIHGLAPTYSCVDPGQPLALIGSTGYVEIAVREGNAARSLGLGVDSPVLCRIPRAMQLGGQR